MSFKGEDVTGQPNSTEQHLKVAGTIWTHGDGHQQINHKKEKMLFYYYNVYVLHNLKAVICQATIKYSLSASKKL